MPSGVVLFFLSFHLYLCFKAHRHERKTNGWYKMMGFRLQIMVLGTPLCSKFPLHTEKSSGHC